MILLLTLLEQTTANFFLEVPFSPSPAGLPPSKMASARVRQPSTSFCSFLALFVSPPSTEPPEDDVEEEEEPRGDVLSSSSPESSEKGCIGGGGGRGTRSDADVVDFADISRRVAGFDEPVVAGAGAGAGAGTEARGRPSPATLLFVSRALFMVPASLQKGDEMCHHRFTSALTRQSLSLAPATPPHLLRRIPRCSRGPGWDRDSQPWLAVTHGCWVCLHQDAVAIVQPDCSVFCATCAGWTTSMHLVDGRRVFLACVQRTLHAATTSERRCVVATASGRWQVSEVSVLKAASGWHRGRRERN